MASKPEPDQCSIAGDKANYGQFGEITLWKLKVQVFIRPTPWRWHPNRKRFKDLPPMSKKRSRPSAKHSAQLTIPELEQSKMAVLHTLASPHSRRRYKYATEKFIAWYCGDPRLGFNRAVMVRYRSFLENQSLSAATINLHLSAIRRLADEAAESGCLSSEVVTGIRRVKGLKQLGRRICNWLTSEQAQKLVNAISKKGLRDCRDAAAIGLLLGCGLRRAEVAALRLEQFQQREDHWLILDLVGKGGRLRTVPVPDWCKTLVDMWLHEAGVRGGKVFRRSGSPPH
jgi:integrase